MPAPEVAPSRRSAVAATASRGVPSERISAANCGTTSPARASASSAAESLVVCDQARRTTASTVVVVMPAARCQASQPQRTSSPSGVSPGPAPTRSATVPAATSGMVSRRRRIGPLGTSETDRGSGILGTPAATIRVIRTGVSSRCSTPPRTETAASANPPRSARASRSPTGSAADRDASTPTRQGVSTPVADSSRSPRSAYTAWGPRCTTDTRPSGLAANCLRRRSVAAAVIEARTMPT